MRTQLLTWRSSLYASLGLVAFACGGQTDRPGSTVQTTGGTSGTGGNAGNVSQGGAAGWIVDFGGAGGMPGGSGGSAGMAGTGGTGTGGTGTGGTHPVDLGCNAPRPYPGTDGKDTGFVACTGGFVH